mgnify:FL=1
MQAAWSRRSFLLSVGSGMAGVRVALGPVSREKPVRNLLPRWRGFNLLDYFSPFPPRDPESSQTTDDEFRWMRDWGFDFVRLPMAYPRYIRFDSSRPVTPEEVLQFEEEAVAKIHKVVDRANGFGLHVSLNLHRAPGYCVNAGFQEPYNLWTDEAAQNAFCRHWTMWAERFRSYSPRQVSFDLVNEPSMRDDMNDQHAPRRPVPGDLYRKVALRAAEAIWSANPDHLVIADGNDVGARPIPEIADLNIGQSCRGYYPHYISHYRAPWVFKDPDSAPKPSWPMTVEGKTYGRKDLEEFYRPWIETLRQGVGVHCGECGGWRETPHDVFLAWFEDVLQILTEHEIGYALWNFRGDFGILDSGRRDVVYEDWYSHGLDRKFLDLLKRY